LKNISNAASSKVELKAKKAYDFLESKCVIPVEPGRHKAIFEEFNFPFQVSDRYSPDEGRAASSNKIFNFDSERGVFEKEENVGLDVEIWPQQYRFVYGLKHKLLQVLKLLKFNANEKALIGFREILLDFDAALEMLPLFL
jgi:hypothetical protein